MYIITVSRGDTNVLMECGFDLVLCAEKETPTTIKHYLEQFKPIIRGDRVVVVTYTDALSLALDEASKEVFPGNCMIADKEHLGDSVVAIYAEKGCEGVRRFIREALERIQGFRDVTEDPYRGVAAMEGSYIPTGLPDLDHAINDLAPEQLTLLTGRSNEGKTTLVNQIIASAIKYENRVLWVSGEGVQEIILNRFYQAIIGRDENCYKLTKVNKRYFKEPKPDVLQKLRQWHKGKLFLFSKGDSDLKTTDQLFSMIKKQTEKRRYNLIVIDNLMSVLSSVKAAEKLEAQADFAQRCADLSKKYHLHIILVLHPNKTLRKGDSMDFEQISGTQDLANKADNIIFVRREYPEEGEQEMPQELREPSGQIVLLKNRYFSELPHIDTYFDPDTGTLSQICATGEVKLLDYGWNKIKPKIKLGEDARKLLPDWAVDKDDQRRIAKNEG